MSVKPAALEGRPGRVDGGGVPLVWGCDDGSGIVSLSEADRERDAGLAATETASW